jgi:hypothetical protein
VARLFAGIARETRKRSYFCDENETLTAKAWQWVTDRSSTLTKYARYLSLKRGRRLPLFAGARLVRAARTAGGQLKCVCVDSGGGGEADVRRESKQKKLVNRKKCVDENMTFYFLCSQRKHGTNSPTLDPNSAFCNVDILKTDSPWTVRVFPRAQSTKMYRFRNMKHTDGWMDGRTDGRTDGRKHARTHAPWSAGRGTQPAARNPHPGARASSAAAASRRAARQTARGAKCA